MKDAVADLIFRNAREEDLPYLVQLLADDPLGASREKVTTPIDKRYADAFSRIDEDANNQLVVIEKAGQVIAMLQLTFIPYLTHTGSWRCLIEGVRVHVDFRGRGIGRLFFEWAIKQARERGCQIVQLTSNKQRPEAIRFYSSLGFVASHLGFKLTL